MKALKLCEGVYWVGAIDWNLRNFHGYETEKGSTYNAYLVLEGTTGENIVPCIKFIEDKWAKV